MNLGYFETSLDVADIERSLAFYQVLGFEPVDGGVEVRTVSLRKGDCRLGLYQGHLDPARPAETTPRTATGVGPGFGHSVLGLAAADLEQSLAFYARLGFSESGRQARSATMGLGDCAISLHEGFAQGSAQLTFWQGDLDQIARGLAAQGLVFERGPATDFGEEALDALLVRDPDGHVIRFTNVQPV